MENEMAVILMDMEYIRQQVVLDTIYHSDGSLWTGSLAIISVIAHAK